MSISSFPFFAGKQRCLCSVLTVHRRLING
uniref:Orf in vapA promoter region protein n=1 Tax=Aeromonas salmonicida TaxID=645 RepID=Q53380_AERSA|nr:vapA [Aeromonas salmonicida]